MLENLEPKKVFQYFEEICSIPHGSRETKAISDYLVNFAKDHELKYIQDELNNVIIFQDGTAGYENAEPVMIQGHMDMVCEKEDGVNLDMSKEGLKLLVEDGYVTADGTTLGGDDGIAVAYALAILDSDDIPHAPLEVAITVDEEIGMLGAAGIDTTPLKAKYMLNMDSEDEGFLLVSCAGGETTTAHLPINRERHDGIRARLTVSGLIGGHSGVEIDKGRMNSNFVLGRVLYQLKKEVPFALESLQGGLKDNAIPRRSEAVLVFDFDEDMEDARETLKELQVILSNENKVTDPDIKLELVELREEKEEKSKTPKGQFDFLNQKKDNTISFNDKKEHRLQPMDVDSTDRVVAALYNLPNGIQRMSFDIPGLVETSLNMGIMKTEEDEVTFAYSVRSSVNSEKEELVDRIRSLMDILDGYVDNMGEYPAWEYQKDSKLRDLMANVFRQQYGKDAVIQSIHAGVECGLFVGKMPGLDAVSFGPEILDIHTPKERLNIASVERTWKFVLEVLKELK